MKNSVFYENFLTIVISIFVIWFIWFFIKPKNYILYYK